MNHEATRLTEHLTALRRASQDVIDSLTQLKAQNQVKQEKEAKEKQKELKRIKESISQVQQELEVLHIICKCVGLLTFQSLFNLLVWDSGFMEGLGLRIGCN